MTTTIGTLKETDKIVGQPVTDPGLEQEGKAVDEAAPRAVPWSVLAPSDYAVLSRMFGLRILAEGRPTSEMGRVAPVRRSTSASPTTWVFECERRRRLAVAYQRQRP